MRLRLIAFLAFTLGSVPAAVDTAPPPVLGKWIAAQQRMGDLNVAFKLTRTLPSLKAPIVTEGHFWRLADGRFRWELGSPPETVLLYDGTELNLWDAEKQKWQALSPHEGRMRMWMRFLNSRELTAEALTKDFNATVTGSEAHAVTVALQPKGLAVRRHLRQVDLQIDPATDYLRQIRLIQSDGGAVLMSFGNAQPFTDKDKRRLSLQPNP